MLDAFITSKARRKLLAVLLLSPKKEFYLRELARHSGQPANVVLAETRRFVRAGLLFERQSGRQKYYSVNPGFPILKELTLILVKTEGIGVQLAKALSVPGVRAAFVFGSLAAGEEKSHSDIDLVVVGEPELPALAKAVSKTEEFLGRSINYITYPENEFTRKAKTSGFLANVLRGPKIFLKGDDDELKRLAED